MKLFTAKKTYMLIYCNKNSKNDVPGNRVDYSIVYIRNRFMYVWIKLFKKIVYEGWKNDFESIKII